MSPTSAGIVRKPTTAPLRRTSAALVGCLGLLLLAGCVFGGGPHGTVLVLRETPSPSEIVVESGMSPPAACVVGVNQPPPPPKAENRPKSPDKNAVWQAGNWRYYSGHFVWVEGRWAQPPRPHAAYTPPQWEIRDGNNMFTEGYWHF